MQMHASVSKVICLGLKSLFLTYSLTSKKETAESLSCNTGFRSLAVMLMTL